MPTLLSRPARVHAAGNKPKLIDEYIGRLNSNNEAMSVAHMHSPAGWQEPGQRPEFEEFTVVLHGMLRVEYHGGAVEVPQGQAVITHKGEWVRYSTPEPEAAEYIAVSSPHFRRKGCIEMARESSWIKRGHHVAKTGVHVRTAYS